MTSASDLEAENFVSSGLRPHGERYARARSLPTLPSHSGTAWRQRSGTLVDGKSGVYADPAKLHPVDHRGTHFTTQALLDSQRSLQGRPVMVQAGASDVGKDLAARTADVVFSAAQTLGEAQAFYADLKARLPKFGRSRDDLKIMPGVSPIVGSTTREARAKYDALQDLIPDEVGVALLASHPQHQEPLRLSDPRAIARDAAHGRHPEPATAHYRSRRTPGDNLSIRASTAFHHLRRQPRPTGRSARHPTSPTSWRLAFAVRAPTGSISCPRFSRADSRVLSLRSSSPSCSTAGLFRQSYEGTTLRENLGLSRQAVDRAAHRINERQSVQSSQAFESDAFEVIRRAQARGGGDRGANRGDVPAHCRRREFAGRVHSYRRLARQALASLTGETGWLTPIALSWLKDGENSFGRRRTEAFSLNDAALAADTGVFVLTNGRVRYVAHASKAMTYLGKPVASLDLASDADAKPTELVAGSLHFMLIQRAGHLGIRVRDSVSPNRLQFKGLEYFPVRPDWDIHAHFEPYVPEHRIPIVNILGMTEDMISPGAIVFERGGRSWRLDAILEAPGSEVVRDVFGCDERQADLWRRSLPVRRIAEGRSHRGRLQRSLQPAVRLHGLRDLPAAAAAESARLGDRCGRAQIRAPALDWHTLRLGSGPQLSENASGAA